MTADAAEVVNHLCPLDGPGRAVCGSIIMVLARTMKITAAEYIMNAWAGGEIEQRRGERQVG